MSATAATTASDVIRLTLPDGSVREVPKGTTGRTVAASIGAGLAKDALAVKLNGRVLDLSRPLAESGPFEVVTPRHPDALELYRHSTAHLTANAVKRLFPGVKIGIGPAIENGYYYDFDPGRPFTPEDLEKIEAEMRKIVAEDNEILRLDMPKGEAVKIFEAQNDPLKVEIVSDIPDATVSCYRQADFIDLCRGPHVPSTGKLGVFKLTHAAGAYWKGDERNPMLQRIYGASFLTQKELDEHLARLEAAKARDHRKVGKELGLFLLHPLAPASPFFLPKGATVYNLLVQFMRELYVKYGYQEVISPQIFDVELFKQSGHYDNYRENMYFTQIDEREFGVKPMNCPGHFLMYGSHAFSYRDLPVRYADFGRLHRYERSGVTQGLTRVRTFCQDDSHIFVTLDQMPAEMDRFLDFIHEVYATFGFGEVKVGLGTRPEKFMGEVANWDKAETALARAFEKRAASLAGWSYFMNHGDGAFYGPKLDFQVTDAIGRAWQLGTLQVDFSNPERFDLHYTAEDGSKQRPVVLHRAILGSLERFFGILIEHTGGDFPFWLAPEQVRVVPVSEKANAYAEDVLRRLVAGGLRATADLRNEKLGARIRDGELSKVPALLIVGEKEAAAGTVSLRLRHGKEEKNLSLHALIGRMKTATASRSLAGLAEPTSTARQQ
ncbi:MAG TPA: threonine--tRNA ligase [Thermoanaerobaculia bacterium]|nr:threonine--tRNA ligase [Thermoanaerobaculia bacterium]HQR65889.1 threonine--tRNA ligase [Thermoanaerobaculia bacterium]